MYLYSTGQPNTVDHEYFVLTIFRVGKLPYVFVQTNE